jgi:hypothetical protein
MLPAPHARTKKNAETLNKVTMWSKWRPRVVCARVLTRKENKGQLVSSCCAEDIRSLIWSSALSVAQKIVDELGAPLECYSWRLVGRLDSSNVRVNG